MGGRVHGLVVGGWLIKLTKKWVREQATDTWGSSQVYIVWCRGGKRK